MNKLIISTILAAGLTTSVAIANETEAFCVEFAGGNGWDTEPCGCVGEVGEADPAVKEALLALSAPEDVDALDDSVKEALSVCFP